jgi:hypothetical protein
MDDEAIIAELIAIRGIGRWTAMMFLDSDTTQCRSWTTSVRSPHQPKLFHRRVCQPK